MIQNKTPNQSGLSAVKTVLLVCGSLLTVAIIYFTVDTIRYNNEQKTKIAAERDLYTKLDKEAGTYINAIAQKYPGEITHERYCDYSSAKYGKGSLGCSVGYKIETNGNDTADLELAGLVYRFAKQTTWGVPVDNLADYDKKNGVSAKYLFYVDDHKRCSVVAYDVGEPKRTITASCSGNALAEYYPVR